MASVLIEASSALTRGLFLSVSMSLAVAYTTHITTVDSAQRQLHILTNKVSEPTSPCGRVLSSVFADCIQMCSELDSWANTKYALAQDDTIET